MGPRRARNALWLLVLGGCQIVHAQASYETKDYKVSCEETAAIFGQALTTIEVPVPATAPSVTIGVIAAPAATPERPQCIHSNGGTGSASAWQTLLGIAGILGGLFTGGIL